MAHKAPAAFGLCSVLLGEGVNRAAARRALLLFSIAAPAGALLTFWLIGFISTHDHDLQWWTAMALLLSGGTMLFVATHLLQEVGDMEHDETNDVGVGRTSKIATLIFGMMTPVFLQSLLAQHHHG
jgi:solute carrier family 39 (zinc transporter), member 9